MARGRDRPWLKGVAEKGGGMPFDELAVFVEHCGIRALRDRGAPADVGGAAAVSVGAREASPGAGGLSGQANDGGRPRFVRPRSSGSLTRRHLAVGASALLAQVLVGFDDRCGCATGSGDCRGPRLRVVDGPRSRASVSTAGGGSIPGTCVPVRSVVVRRRRAGPRLAGCVGWSSPGASPTMRCWSKASAARWRRGLCRARRACIQGELVLLADVTCAGVSRGVLVSGLPGALRADLESGRGLFDSVAGVMAGESPALPKARR